MKVVGAVALWAPPATLGEVVVRLAVKAVPAALDAFAERDHGRILQPAAGVRQGRQLTVRVLGLNTLHLRIANNFCQQENR